MSSPYPVTQIIYRNTEKYWAKERALYAIEKYFLGTILQPIPYPTNYPTAQSTVI